MQTKTNPETLIETNKPGFLQEVIENGPRSSTDSILKSESEVYGENLSKLYGEEPNHFTD
jgi:hypothetical protein